MLISPLVRVPCKTHNETIKQQNTHPEIYVNRKIQNTRRLCRHMTKSGKEEKKSPHFWWLGKYWYTYYITIKTSLISWVMKVTRFRSRSEERNTAIAIDFHFRDNMADTVWKTKAKLRIIKSWITFPRLFLQRGGVMCFEIENPPPILCLIAIGCNVY